MTLNDLIKKAQEYGIDPDDEIELRVDYGRYAQYALGFDGGPTIEGGGMVLWVNKDYILDVAKERLK